MRFVHPYFSRRFFCIVQSHISRHICTCSLKRLLPALRRLQARHGLRGGRGPSHRHQACNCEQSDGIQLSVADPSASSTRLTASPGRDFAIASFPVCARFRLLSPIQPGPQPPARRGARARRPEGAQPGRSSGPPPDS